MNNLTEILKTEDLYMEFNVKRKKQRVWITTPDGSEPIFEEIKVDNTLLKALIKANSWQKKLDKGRFNSAIELAEYLKVSKSYFCYILSLNYLSPKIKAMILDGKQPKILKLQDIIANVPTLWKEQYLWLEE